SKGSPAPTGRSDPRLSLRGWRRAGQLTHGRSDDSAADRPEYSVQNAHRDSHYRARVGRQIRQQTSKALLHTAEGNPLIRAENVTRDFGDGLFVFEWCGVHRDLHSSPPDAVTGQGFAHRV